MWTSHYDQWKTSMHLKFWAVKMMYTSWDSPRTSVARVFKRPYRSKHSSSATRLKRDCSPEQDHCPHSDRDAEDSTEQPTCSTELHEGSSCSSKCLPETSTLVDTTNNSPVLHNQGHIPLEEQSRRVMKMVAFPAIIFLLGIFSAFVHGFRLPSGTCKPQMQLKLRHQNEILQQHLQREIDDFRGQIAELQIQVATLAKTHGRQCRRTKKHPVGSVDSWVQGNSDRIQREDFALKSLGASVVKYSESYKTGAHICMFGLCWEYSRSPDVILQSHPSACCHAGSYCQGRLSDRRDIQCPKELCHLWAERRLWREGRRLLRGVCL
ncbi:uncharacterized protein LOC123378814 isoform X4 [Mauremys mutica]|uniref:uncharacterized protein LOC123378814 isoform X4 n=2 Tax=Mauremys mutica TaxID=74926 RepID=UPI001D13A0D2|nr:uncharacterized protein LOC123378814 isoform X4 [Mauremys mutica]